MTMWLPLGLASGVTVAQLSAQMSLCKYAKPYDWFVPCNPVKFSLSQSNKGQLLMTVPSFLPREHYKLVVKGTDQVRPDTSQGLAPWLRCEHLSFAYLPTAAVGCR